MLRVLKRRPFFRVLLLLRYEFGIKDPNAKKTGSHPPFSRNIENDRVSRNSGNAGR
jgi:hypothetical protein